MTSYIFLNDNKMTPHLVDDRIDPESIIIYKDKVKTIYGESCANKGLVQDLNVDVAPVPYDHYNKENYFDHDDHFSHFDHDNHFNHNNHDHDQFNDDYFGHSHEERYHRPHHPPHCNCYECQRERDNGKYFNFNRKPIENRYVFNLKYLAFPYESSTYKNQTKTYIGLNHSDKNIDVLSKKFNIVYKYAIVGYEDHNRVQTEDREIRTTAEFKYFRDDSSKNGEYLNFVFNEFIAEDIITIPRIGNCERYQLKFLGFKLLGNVIDRRISIDQNNLIFTKGSPYQVELYNKDFESKINQFTYNIKPHDRIRLVFDVIFNNLSFFNDLNYIEKVMTNGIDYRFIDDATLPAYNNLTMYYNRDIPLSSILPIADLDGNHNIMLNDLYDRLSRTYIH